MSNSREIRYSKFADRIDLDEVYAELGYAPDQTDGKGNDIGQCPLPYGQHANGDTTGKFAIHRDKKVYNCWVCGGGSLLELVMTMKDMDDSEATDWLYQFTGAKEERGEDYIARMQKLLHPESKKEAGSPYYNPKILEKWVAPDHPYFASRGIPAEVAEYFRLGFNKSNRKYAPKKNGVPIDEPFVGPAVIFPHFFKQRLQGWQIRWLTDDRPKWAKKYDNTGDFPRQHTLWGWDFCRLQTKAPVVVESVPTALFLIGLGIPAMATFGAVVNEAQIKLLRPFQQGVILSPDKGSAGEDGYWKACGMLRRYVPVGWLEPHPDLNEKEDLGDLCKAPKRVHNYVEEEAKWVFASTNP